MWHEGQFIIGENPQIFYYPPDQGQHHSLLQVQKRGNYLKSVTVSWVLEEWSLKMTQHTKK